MTEASQQSTFELVRDNIAATPFHQWLKPVLVGVDEAKGSVTVHLTIRPEFARRADRRGVHGGVLAALVDIAGHAAIASKLRHGAATIDLRIDYVKLAEGDELRATATVIKVGRTIGLVDVHMTDELGKIVAIGRCTYLTARL